MVTTMYTGLFVLYIWKFKGYEIGEEKNPGHYHNFLPEYCVRRDSGRLDYTDSYTQWVYQGDNEYILFEMEPVDEWLKNEVTEGGIEDIFKDIDLRELFKDFQVHSYKDRAIPRANYLTVTMEYVGSNYPEPDWELVYGKPKVLKI